MDDVFAPPGERWVRVSPRLLALQRTLLVAVLGSLTLAAALATANLIAPWLAAAVAAAGLAVGAWWWWILGRAWRAWGYAEREDDLVVTHGVLIRRLTVVPYGRMQFVDVTAGPLDRRFGIATVRLHTASAATDAAVPGLEPDEAARLRDRLAALGQQRSAGL